MQIDCLSRLNIDISTGIFFYLSLDSKINCLELNKTINNVMSYTLLFNASTSLQKNDRYSPQFEYYRPLMKSCRRRCKYFVTKLPEIFENLKECKTLIDANSVVSERLEREGSWKNTSLLDEIWYVFMRQAGYEECDISPRLTHAPYKNHSEEMRILLGAGAKLDSGPVLSTNRDDLSFIVEQTWCNRKAIKFLFNRKDIRVSAGTAVTATKNPQYSRLLSLFFKSIESYPFSPSGKDYSLKILLKGVSPVHESHVGEYVNKGFRVSPGNLTLALEREYSEQFILKLLEQCFDVGNDHLMLALQRNCSEEFILELLRVCDELLLFSTVKAAFEEDYSEKVILELLKKCPNRADVDYYLWLSAQKQFSEELILELLAGIVTCNTIDVLITSGKNYQESVEKFITFKLQGTFELHTPWIAMQKGYSESVFLYVFNRVSNQCACITQSWASIKNQVVESYSEMTVKMLVGLYGKYSIELENEMLDAAIRRRFSEEVIFNILDLVNDVDDDTIEIAKQYYSNKLIEKMREKSTSTLLSPSQSTYCVIQ